MKSDTIIETISRRKSVRNFDESLPVELEKREHLQKIIEELSTTDIRIELITSALTGIKLGTYGFITGATGFLVGIIKDRGKETTLAFGRAFEKVVLEATSLGLGTCWMAGTYCMKDFRNYLTLSDDESIVIVSPLGYPSDTKRKRDILLSKLSKSHTRKPWEKIFFNESWNTPLTEESSGSFRQILDMVRIAPSSSNRQPWRVVMQQDTLHLYLHRISAVTFRGYNNGLNDLGIVMTHIDLASQAIGLIGNWSSSEPEALKHKDMEYIQSWTVRE